MPPLPLSTSQLKRAFLICFFFLAPDYRATELKMISCAHTQVKFEFHFRAVWSEASALAPAGPRMAAAAATVDANKNLTQPVEVQRHE